MTPLAASPTYAALLAAICEQPDEDMPRLAFADFLEENGGTVECVKCNGKRTRGVLGKDKDGCLIRLPCDGCSGSGRVPDANTARAAFIRLQVELARLGYPHFTDVWKKLGNITQRDYATMKARESALLLAHEADWRRGERCGRCEGAGKLLPARTAAEDEYEKRTRRRAPFPRPVDCEDCHGIGWTGPLAGREAGGRAHMASSGEALGNPWYSDNDGRFWRWLHPAVWERGFVAEVHAPLADVFGPDGQVTAWAVRLVRAEPVQRLVLSDVEEFRPEALPASLLREVMRVCNPAMTTGDIRVDVATATANVVRAESDRLRELELAAARELATH